MTVTDARGREVVIRKQPRRLVVINSNALEVVRLLGAQDMVVGANSRVGINVAFWGPLAELPMVGRWSSPNYEAIAALRPDLILCYGGNPGPELEDRLGPLGVTVLRLDFYRLPSYVEEVRTLARILGREDRGREYLDWHARVMDRISRAARGMGGGDRAYIEIYTDYKVAGPGSGINEMALAAGCANVGASMRVSSAEVEPEWVAVKNPQVIIKAASSNNSYLETDTSRLDDVRRRIMSRPGFSGVEAVAHGRVHVLSSDICPGPRAFVGVAHMALWCHPGARDAGLDPEAVHREYMERFQGVSYRGVYATGGTP